jgi:rhodanese-related sulfurtransferase
MDKFFIVVILVIVIAVVFTGCKKKDTSPIPSTETISPTTQNSSYEQITPAQAKDIMDNNTDYIILDVRTTEEFNEGHIKDAILIPDYEISEKAEHILTDKEQLILVYCRSGRRSKLAAEELVKLGYTNVKEFGGIIDWEYGTTTE